MTIVKNLLIWIKGLGVLVKGVLEISIIIDTYPKCLTLQQTLMVIIMVLTYNIIIERSFLHKINVVINT